MSIKLTQKPVRVHYDQIHYFSILPKPVTPLTAMERMKLQLDCKINYSDMQKEKEADSRKGKLNYVGVNNAN